MTRLGDALYRMLLLAFPSSFRRRHGVAMLDQFRQQRGLTRGRPVAAVTLWFRAASDAVRHGLAVRREARRYRWFGGSRMTMLDDVRHAARGWRRAPAVAATIVTILTVGISANAFM